MSHSTNIDWLKRPLAEHDPEIYQIIQKEKQRQRDGLELIASENYASAGSLEAVGSCLTNKYSDGYVGKRLCGGTENVDEIEELCQKRALEAFNLNPNEWGVNVQAYSGSPANFAVFTGVVGPRGRIMGLNFADGGHFTHGFMTSDRKISATSKFFETMPYKVNVETGYIDYDTLARNALLFKPNLIIAGICCYSRLIDYKRMREIANENNAYLMADIAHICGMVSAGVIPSPFPYSDIVTTTTHKSLRGPRSGLIFYRKGIRTGLKSKPDAKYNLEQLINDAVFPGLQSGPHNHSIAGVAVALAEAKTQQFVEYQTKVLENAKALARALTDRGYELVTGGTDTHLVLVNLKNKGADGKRVEKVLDAIKISCNKFTCPGQKSALDNSDDPSIPDPLGLRFGSPALTSRGLDTRDFETVCEFVDRGVQLSIEIQNSLEDKTNFDGFLNALYNDDKTTKKIEALRKEVVAYARSLPMPGLDDR